MKKKGRQILKAPNLHTMLADEFNTKESSGLLSAVDRMREILHNEKITLPEIVVVGDQSVGKSSVLEAISGIQLPRAQNICTRCPLELRMKSTTGNEYATIRNSKSPENEAQTLDNMDEISNAVTRVTKEIAGDQINVSSTPIYLTVYKHNLPYDLTIIDLPGITRNPLLGQAKDIHTQILNLIKKYIEPPTAVVLHVIPASVDFTTSETMKLAKEYDPQCLRQLIAVSKIDKYDKNITEKLLGRGPGAMQLKLGCVAVLNRNQDEIDLNLSFEKMREREAEFFTKHHEAFQNLPGENKGVDQLVKKLAIIQRDRIRSTLPQIIEELRKQIREKKLQLKNIPLPMNSEPACWTKFQSMINALRESIRTKVNGDYEVVTSINMNSDGGQMSPTVYSNTSASVKIDETLMAGDNRIAYYVYKFQRQFQNEISKSFSDFYSGDYNKLVLQTIDDAAGVSLPNFPSYQIIQRLFRGELQRLPDICFTLVERIRDYLKKCLLRIFHQTFDAQYFRLIEKLKDVIIQQIDAAENRTNGRVQEILDMEYRVFTMNNGYMENVCKTKNDVKKNDKEQIGEAMITIASSTKNNYLPQATSSAISRLNTRALPSDDALAAIDIQIALSSYALIVQKRVIDSISQTCYHHFITKCALVIDQDLTVACPSSDLVRFMKEPAEQTNRRENLTRSIKAYEDALQLGQDNL